MKKIQQFLGWIGLVVFGAAFASVMLRLDYRDPDLQEIPIIVTFFGALGIMVVGISIVAIIHFVAKGTGKGYTSSRLATIKKQGIVRPEYERFQDCTPAEFGVIIDGQCGRNEMIAEIIHLFFEGYISLEKAGNDVIVPKLSPDINVDSLNVVDKLLLKSIANDTLPSRYDFEEVVSRVLKEKDWLIKRKSDKWGWLAKIPGWVKFFGTFCVILPAIVFAGVFYLYKIEVLDSPLNIVEGSVVGSVVVMYILCVVVGILLAAILAAIIGLIYVLVRNFKSTTIVARNYSPKYKQYYTDVLGLYQYLSVSGMDIMTPDYTTLNFRGIDPLYPYAIAADLDKKIVAMFQLPEDTSLE